MQASIQNPALKVTLKSALLDGFALAFIYLMPTFSHILPFPVYFMEPMRIMVVLAMMHTHRNNAYILALTLPVFSFVIATHPVFFKALLIAIELTAMVGIFYLLRRYMQGVAAIFSAIILSKVFYYAMKLLAVQWALITLRPNESIVGIALWIQLLTTLVISGYVWFILHKKKNANG
ncbi:MAG: hypothetical protein EA361_03895 [Bacteroidetes bacterium]|nr:MAG: hypothetical protein EA361_03895 [Bacteroidota bacterium]